MSDNTALVSLADTMTLGKVLADSGFFADSRQAAQAVVKVLAGREIGFGPVASMTGINIIQGRVALSANLIAAAVKRSGRYDYRVIELTDDNCRIDYFEKGRDRIGSSSFSKADAVRAGTKNMDRFPRNMLFARAMSNGAKWYCADIFGGPIYTPEELGANVNEDGEIVDGESHVLPLQPQAAPAAAPRPAPAPEPPAATPSPNGDAYDADGEFFAAIPNATTERAAAAIKARVVGATRPDEPKAHPEMRSKFKQNLAIALGSSADRHALTAYLFGSDDAETWTQGQLMAANTWLNIGKAGDGYAPSAKFLEDWKVIRAAIMPPVEAEVVGT
jgi:hypothetical protein